MKRVLVVDDDIDLCQTIVLLCQTFPGVECTYASSMDEVTKMDQRAIETDLVILDVSLGPGNASGVEIYHWLKGQGYRGKMVFFTGHAKSNPLVAEAMRVSDVELIEKPVGIERIEDLILGPS